MVQTRPPRRDEEITKPEEITGRHVWKTDITGSLHTFGELFAVLHVLLTLLVFLQQLTSGTANAASFEGWHHDGTGPMNTQCPMALSIRVAEAGLASSWSPLTSRCGSLARGAPVPGG